MDSHRSQDGTIGIDPSVPPALTFMGYLDSRLSGDEEWRLMQAGCLHRDVVVVGALMLCTELAVRFRDPAAFLRGVASERSGSTPGGDVNQVRAVLLHNLAREFARPRRPGEHLLGLRFNATPYKTPDLLEGLSQATEQVIHACLRGHGVDVTDLAVYSTERGRLLDGVRAALMA